jgi:L-fuconolactonase
MIPKIDPHQHLWDLDIIKLGWQDTAPPKLARSHLMREYLRESEGLGIEKTVYMEVDARDSSLAAEADYVLALALRDDNPLIGATLGCRPGTSGFREWIERFKGDARVKGFRQVLHGVTPKGKCLERAFVQDVRTLGEAGFHFELCLRPDDLEDGAQLAIECPDTQFVLDHCGNAPLPEAVSAEPPSCSVDDWKRGIEAAAAESNMVCKISGIVAGAKLGVWKAEDLAPAIEFCAEAFGEDRVIWASDWPVCTIAASLRGWVEAAELISSPWGEARQRKLFYANAERFYRL